MEFALIDELVKTKEFEWGKGEDLDVHYELFLSFGFLAPGENSLSIFDRVSPREGFVFELLAIHGSEMIGGSMASLSLPELGGQAELAKIVVAGLAGFLCDGASLSRDLRSAASTVEGSDLPVLPGSAS